MCGRYTQTASVKTLKERFGFAESVVEIRPRYNIAPTQQAPVVINESGRTLQMFRWGLIPSWATDAAIGNRMVNARSETIMEKPSFKGAFEKRRCLVLADGFYEWRHIKGTKAKVPMRAVLKSREPFAMAGLWENWKAADGTSFKTFTIINTGANEMMKSIHDRMPVILNPQNEAEWLDPNAKAADLTQLLQPWPGTLEAYEVSTIVNSPTHDAPDCIEKFTAFRERSSAPETD